MAEKTKKQDDVKKEKTKKTATAKKSAAVKPAKTAKKAVTAKVSKKPTAKTSKEDLSKKLKKTETEKVTKTKKDSKTTKTASVNKTKEVKNVNKKTSSLQTVNFGEKKKSNVKKVDAIVKNNVTTFLKQKDVVRKWFILDAAGKSLGRVAAFAASILRGKHRVDFTPNVDCGDCIIVVNCKDAVLTGRKLEQKVKYHHSGWIGGLKQTKYNDLMKNKPQKAMEWAIKGMLPHNKLGAKMAKHLKVYRDEKHEHEAQKPELLEFKL